MVQDFNDHPLDSLHVVIWCFDEKHAVLMEEEWKRTCAGLTVVESPEPLRILGIIIWLAINVFGVFCIL